VGVAVLTFVAFAPSLLNQFVDWDDLENFTTNLNYRGLSWTHLKWMWTTTLLGHYVPVTWMTLGIDYLVWGMHPAGYHLTNVLLHSANAVVLYVVALRLFSAAVSGRVAGNLLAWRLSAAFAALFFAVHPLRVESVAWITERRDVLSGLFYLLAIWAYLRDSDVPIGVGVYRRRWYWISLGCFVLALLSKAIVVTLPIVLIVLDVYPLRRLGGPAVGWWTPAARRRWIEKIPFLVGSALVIPIALTAARGAANLFSITDFGMLERAAIIPYGLVFYLRKTVIPVDLSAFYALRTPILLLSAPYVVSGLVVATITLLAIVVRRRWPAISAVWIVYIATLLPVSGVFQNGPQVAADRYSYLPALSWAVLAGASAFACWCSPAARHRGRVLALSMVGCAALITAVLTVLTWKQVAIWRDSERLWTHASAIAPSSVVHSHLAFARRQQGRWAEANEHYRQAALMRPDSVDIQINWGTALALQGRFNEAIDRYREASRIQPQNAALHYFWGNALFAAGDMQEAIRHYREAVRIDPNSAEAYNNWGSALAQLGSWEEAIAKYREALRIKPDYPLASGNLDKVLTHVGRAPSLTPARP
jgi:Tfp pilus assembly protein PilF